MGITYEYFNQQYIDYINITSVNDSRRYDYNDLDIEYIELPNNTEVILRHDNSNEFVDFYINQVNYQPYSKGVLIISYNTFTDEVMDVAVFKMADNRLVLSD